MTAESLKLRCLRCNHSWLRRTDDAPKCCPACKSRKWNEERKVKAMSKDELASLHRQIMQ